MKQEHVLELSGFTQDVLNSILDPEFPESWLSVLNAAQSSPDPRILGITGEIGEQLMEPVRERLVVLGVPPGSHVLLLPQGGLGLLPLHAAARLEAGEPRYFCDDYVVTYAPSAYWYQICDEGAHRTDTPSTWLAVIDPSDDLPYARAEGAALTEAFGNARLLTGPEATRHAVIDAARGVGNVHFACHGEYDWSDTMGSKLHLARSDILTVADILGDALALESTRFVALSACETGLTEFSVSPDEYIGFPTAFTIAGASGVLSSLWRVDDAATYLLMQAFYEDIQHAIQHPLFGSRNVGSALSRRTNSHTSSHTEAPSSPASWKDRMSASARIRSSPIRSSGPDSPTPGPENAENPRSSGREAQRHSRSWFRSEGNGQDFGTWRSGKVASNKIRSDTFEYSYAEAQR